MPDTDENLECELWHNAKLNKRVGHIVVPYNDYIIIWGGFYSPKWEEYLPPHEVWFYNCTTEIWSVKYSKGHNPKGNSGSTAVVINDTLYIFGGLEEFQDGYMYCNKIHSLDLKTLTWKLPNVTGTIPIPCDKTVGWAYNDQFYVFGGYGLLQDYLRIAQKDFSFDIDYSNEEDKGWSNQLSIYCPKLNQWMRTKTEGTPPRPRAAHAADLSGDKVFIFGGRMAESRCNDLHVLNLKTMQWTELLLQDGTDQIPPERSWHTFNFISENCGILYGGLDKNDVPCDDWWECNTTENKVMWRLKGKVTKDKTLVWHQAAVSPFTKELIIIGGVTCSPYKMKEENYVDKCLVVPYTPPSLLRLSLENVIKEKWPLQQMREDHYLPTSLLNIICNKMLVTVNKTTIY